MSKGCRTRAHAAAILERDAAAWRSARRRPCTVSVTDRRSPRPSGVPLTVEPVELHPGAARRPRSHRYGGRPCRRRPASLWTGTPTVPTRSCRGVDHQPTDDPRRRACSTRPRRPTSRVSTLVSWPASVSVQRAVSSPVGARPSRRWNVASTRCAAPSEDLHSERTNDHAGAARVEQGDGVGPRRDASSVCPATSSAPPGRRRRRSSRRPGRTARPTRGRPRTGRSPASPAAEVGEPGRLLVERRWMAEHRVGVRPGSRASSASWEVDRSVDERPTARRRRRDCCRAASRTHRRRLAAAHVARANTSTNAAFPSGVTLRHDVMVEATSAADNHGDRASRGDRS